MMGLVYQPISEMKPHCESQYSDGGWDVNVAGATLLGGLYEQLGLPLDPGNVLGVPRIPYEMNETAAKEIATKLAAVSDDKIEATLNSMQTLWGDTSKEYVQWVRDWQTFLEHCGGYEAN